MFQSFSHYISYGATDQETLRALVGQYDGVVVPGTVAAFQKQGTGGFVLSLSAAGSHTPYVIDPRFPLFQQALLSPKRSHHSLAAAFKDDDLVSGSRPEPADFPRGRLQALARAWADFNETFRDQASTKFDKYAARLGVSLDIPDALPPERILAPYFVVYAADDNWDLMSQTLFEEATSSASSLPVTRVVATESSGVLRSILASVADSNIVIWVSDLNELTVSGDELGDYALAVAEATAAGKNLAALYGGFFSVALSAAGLAGSCHGIGFSESRAWIELPQSGPPPARYYFPGAHRFVGQELAQTLFLIDPATACSCSICAGRPPLALDYHDLMKHSVAVRNAEIAAWSGLTVAAVIDRLRNEQQDLDSLRARLAASPYVVGAAGHALADHFPRWITALQRVA